MTSRNNMICLNLSGNRAPFDLTEDESELLSGFNAEYANSPSVLFFIAGYINIITINGLATIIFLNTTSTASSLEIYTTNFMLKTLSLTILFL